MTRSLSHQLKKDNPEVCLTRNLHFGLAIGGKQNDYAETQIFPGGSAAKNLPAVQEMRVRSSGDQEVLWRRKWQPTLESLPGKSHGQRSLEAYSPWGHENQALLSY